MNNFKFKNSEFEIVNTSQFVYDSFNNFIFSDDINVFSKLTARFDIFKSAIDVPGDIVECGVYKGSGLLTWLKLKRTFIPNSLKKVIGFDMFDDDNLLNMLNGDEKIKMQNLFEGRNFAYKNYEKKLYEIILKAGFNESEFELIKGDASIKTFDFANSRPGFKISILYLDMDLQKPTYDTLVNFWDRISRGGVVVLDEYAHHQWSESIGVDKFADERNLKIEVLNNQIGPSAIIRKL